LQKVFHADYINLTHNTGVYLYKNLLAVLSLQYQQIHLLRLTDDGQLIDLKTIGEFCYGDDAMFLSRTEAGSDHRSGTGAATAGRGTEAPSSMSLSSIMQPPVGFHFFDPRERPHQFVSGLKHFFMVFLWRRARKPVLPPPPPSPPSVFLFVPRMPNWSISLTSSILSPFPRVSTTCINWSSFNYIFMSTRSV